MKLSRLLLCIAIAGCASSRPEPISGPDAEGPSPDDASKLEAYRGRLVEIDAELRDSLAEAKPRCDRQCTLASQVCDLSDRICGIAQRHADDSDHDFAATCRDGRARCERAKQQVSSCACPAP